MMTSIKNNLSQLAMKTIEKTLKAKKTICMNMNTLMKRVFMANKVPATLVHHLIPVKL